MDREGNDTSAWVVGFLILVLVLVHLVMAHAWATGSSALEVRKDKEKKPVGELVSLSCI